MRKNKSLIRSRRCADGSEPSLFPSKATKIKLRPKLCIVIEHPSRLQDTRSLPLPLSSLYLSLSLSVSYVVVCEFKIPSKIDKLLLHILHDSEFQINMGFKRERERERESERERACMRACMRACVVYYNTKLWAQFYVSGLLGNRDGSDQSAYLRNLIRLFFFRISSETAVHT